MCLLLLYIAILIYFVLFSDQLGRADGYNTYRYNLVPFQEIHRFIAYRDSVPMWAFLVNMIGNVLVFVPIGFLLPIIGKGEVGLVRSVVNAFVLSLCIETLQLVTRVGVFDVDDLILNTLGGAIGWMAFSLIRKLFYQFIERKDNT